MFTKIVLPLIAIVLIAFAVMYLAEAGEKMPELPPPIQPAENPFPQHGGRRRHGRAADREHRRRLAGAGHRRRSAGEGRPEGEGGRPAVSARRPPVEGRAGSSQARHSPTRQAQLARLEAMPRPGGIAAGRSAGPRGEGRLGELGAAVGPRREAPHPERDPRGRVHRPQAVGHPSPRAIQPRGGRLRAAQGRRWEPDKQVAQSAGDRPGPGPGRSKRKPSSIGWSYVRWSTAKCCK